MNKILAPLAALLPALLLAACSGPADNPANATFDLKIVNGLVYDGSGDARGRSTLVFQATASSRWATTSARPSG